jgi:hypothetical protein
VSFRRLALLGALLLVGCAGGPPPPDWKIEAHAALEAYAQHELEGKRRLAAREFERARSALARTGRADLLARAELTRCALRVASLEFEPCTGFEALREDAPTAERAYADFLAGRWGEIDPALLPAQYRAIVATGGAPEAALAGIADPRSRLIAAAVVLRVERMTPAGIALATETASDQGWRRPLLAWLGVQRARAEAAGDAAQVARLRRRVDLILGGAAKPR